MADIKQIPQTELDGYSKGAAMESIMTYARNAIVIQQQPRP
jgi:hypothetical protein